jgi:hypothetical protein
VANAFISPFNTQTILSKSHFYTAMFPLKTYTLRHAAARAISQTFLPYLKFLQKEKGFFLKVKHMMKAGEPLWLSG